MAVSNGYHPGQDTSFTNKLIHNYSTVLTTNSISDGGNTTTEAKLFTVTVTAPSTTGTVFDAAASGWPYATDILDKFLFVCACVA